MLRGLMASAYGPITLGTSGVGKTFNLGFAAAPELETRLNPATGDVEVKYENDRFWNVLIPCATINDCK